MVAVIPALPFRVSAVANCAPLTVSGSSLVNVPEVCFRMRSPVALLVAQEPEETYRSTICPVVPEVLPVTVAPMAGAEVPASKASLNMPSRGLL